MAKSSTVKSGGPARVRLIVLDAELPDGDLGSLTQALQNALRVPSTTVVHRTAPTTNGPKSLAHQPPLEDEVIEVEEEIEDFEEADATPRQTKPRAPRKAPKTPNVIEIEMNGDVSLASFAANKKADSAHKKYLIAAAWLYEHRNIPAVTDGHIYTCFRSIGWSTNIADFAQPLRKLKTLKFFTTPEKGHYAINHLGLDYVKKLRGDGNS